jgi:hypothetical protein
VVIPEAGKKMAELRLRGNPCGSHDQILQRQAFQGRATNECLSRLETGVLMTREMKPKRFTRHGWLERTKGVRNLRRYELH